MQRTYLSMLIHTNFEREREGGRPLNHLFNFQLQALEEKEKGNAAYKKKEFTAALEHYDKAIELDPANVTFITNKAGTLYESLLWNPSLRASILIWVYFNQDVPARW